MRHGISVTGVVCIRVFLRQIFGSRVLSFRLVQRFARLGIGFFSRPAWRVIRLMGRGLIPASRVSFLDRGQQSGAWRQSGVMVINFSSSAALGKLSTTLAIGADASS